MEQAGKEHVSDERDLGEYRLLRPLGRGGMAQVHLAQRRDGGKDAPYVVIKRILGHLAAEQRFVDLFQREARMAIRVRHPNIVRVFEIGMDGDEHFLVMEYLDGLSLREVAKRAWRARRTLPLEGVLRAGIDAARGLAHAHALVDDEGEPAPLIHRDISPDNIVLCRDGTAKVVDFGLAKTMREEDNLTRSTELRGKLAYMSPEQLQGQLLDGRSDVYSLGVSLYWLLTARSPFRGNTDAITIFNVLSRPPPPPLEENPTLPAAVAEVVLHAMEKDRERRTPSATALCEALGALEGLVGDAQDCARMVETCLALPANLPRPADDASRPVPCAPRRGDETVVGGPVPLSRLPTLPMPAAPPEATVRMSAPTAPLPLDTLLEESSEPELATLDDEDVSLPPSRTFVRHDEVAGPNVVLAPLATPESAPLAAMSKPRGALVAGGLLLGTLLAVTLVLSSARSAGDADTTLVVEAVASPVGAEAAEAPPSETPPSETPPSETTPQETTPQETTPQETTPEGEPTRADVAERAPSAEPASRRSTRRRQRQGKRSTVQTPRAEPSDRSVAIELKGPKTLRWSAAGRALEVRGDEARVPASTSSLKARDKRTGGVSQVPVRDGRADYEALGKGSVFFLIRPWARVKLGARDLGATPFDPVTLPAGRYSAELRLEGRTLRRSFEIKAGAQTTVAVDMGEAR